MIIRWPYLSRSRRIDKSHSFEWSGVRLDYQFPHGHNSVKQSGAGAASKWSSSWPQLGAGVGAASKLSSS